MTTHTTPARAANALPGQGMRVALFVTCMNDVMFPGTGRATVKLLERLGCTVEFPREQTCCAQITTNTGYFDESVPAVRSYVKAFADYDYVVSPSGSCTAAVRDQHPMIARHTGDQGLVREVDAIHKRVFDVQSSSSTSSAPPMWAPTSRTWSPTTRPAMASASCAWATSRCSCWSRCAG